MNTFKLTIRDLRDSEIYENVTSFVGEDASGSFGIQANHAQFITSLVYGLARFKQEDGIWRYVAVPGAVLYFIGNEMKLISRRFLISDDYELMSNALLNTLASEEQALSEVKHNLQNIETNILRRMLEMSKR